MVFAHDTELSLQYAAALINTAPGFGDDTEEELPTVASLVAHLDSWDWSGGRPCTRAELEEVHALRPRLRELWGGVLVAIGCIGPCHRLLRGVQLRGGRRQAGAAGNCERDRKAAQERVPRCREVCEAWAHMGDRAC